MDETKIVIIGSEGMVGKSMFKIFPNALSYDPPAGITTSKDTVNNCDLAVICVPTNTKDDEWSCDTTIIDEIFKWLKTPLVLIKSTVKPKTTKRLQGSYDGGICHSPEYIGASSYYTPAKYPNPKNPLQHGFMIIGGRREYTRQMVDIFQAKMGPHTKFMQTDATTSEIIKYIENVFGAMKVTFCNEIYECCEALGVDYREVREGWLLDPRTEPFYTAVFAKKRGYNSHCWNKDIRAFIKSVEEHGYDPSLLKEAIDTNNRIRAKYKLSST